MATQNKLSSSKSNLKESQANKKTKVKHFDSIVKKDVTRNTSDFLVSNQKVQLKIDNTKEKLSNNKITKIDDDKRFFLKAAGVAGIGLAAATLLPKGADAYIAGSTPASNVVGLKNISNNKINPATEETLVQIKQNSDKFNFDNDGKLLIKSDATSGADIVGVKNSSDVRINPATEESLLNVGANVNDQGLWMLRKILTLLKPLGMTTGAGSNRLSVDINSGSVTVSTISTVTTVTTVASMTNLVNIGNINSFSLMKDSARNAYANSIRSKISF